MKKLIITLIVFTSLYQMTHVWNLKAKEDTVDICKKCCAQGTWTSPECCAKCGGCDAYNDGGATQCRYKY